MPAQKAKNGVLTIVKGPVSANGDSFYLKTIGGKTILDRVTEKLPSAPSDTVYLLPSSDGPLAKRVSETSAMALSRMDDAAPEALLKEIKKRPHISKIAVTRFDFPFADPAVTGKMLGLLDDGESVIRSFGFPQGLAIEEAMTREAFLSATAGDMKGFTAPLSSAIPDVARTIFEVAPEGFLDEASWTPYSYKVSSDDDASFIEKFLSQYGLDDINCASLNQILRSSGRLSGPAAYTRHFTLNVLLAIVAFIGKALTRWRLARLAPSSIWGVTPIITLKTKSMSDRLLGVRADSLVWDTFSATSNFDHILKGSQEKAARISPTLGRSLHWLVLCWALLKYDFFHYFLDRGVVHSNFKLGINHLEMILIKDAGKRLFTYTYGADVRTRRKTLALGEFNCCMDCPDIGGLCVCSDERGRFLVKRASLYADAMMALGDMLNYVPGAVNTFFWPIDVKALPTASFTPPKGRPFVIVHSPNHPHFKGTRFLRDAVERLKLEGYDIEFAYMSGLPNSEILRLYSRADIFAEQFVIGLYGYAGIEGMALGRPVMCYVREGAEMISKDDCPVILSSPAEIYGTLKKYLDDPSPLADIGAHGRKYVEKYYSPEAFAARHGKMYLEHAALPDKLKKKILRRVKELEADITE